jgi:hypothetical protein
VPLLELDQELSVEVAAQFNPASGWNPNEQLDTLKRVFDKARGPEEKTVLLKLCELLQSHPAHGSRLFAKPLFHKVVHPVRRCEI